MRESTIEKGKQSRTTYEVLEEIVRHKVQEFIQGILEEEITEFLGRGKIGTDQGIDKPRGYRNGYGKHREFALSNGTITVRRTWIRGEKGFESKVLSLFKRRSKEVGELLPELYLHGLAKADFELALRVNEVNATVRGWVGYFHYRNCSHAMGHIRNHVEQQLIAHLRKRHKVRDQDTSGSRSGRYTRGTGFTKCRHQRAGRARMPCNKEHRKAVCGKTSCTV